jgi:hypothetical protein
MGGSKMNNKKLLRGLGVLVIAVLALSLTKSIFFNSASLSIAAQASGPRVISQNPIEGQRLDLSSPIEVTFDRDMDAAKTGDSFSLLSNGEAVSGKLTWLDARTLSFAPTARLMPATIYTALFSSGAAAQDGSSPKENIEIQFRTVEALAVSQVFPALDTQDVDLNTSITVIFNHPVVSLTITEEQGKLPQPLKFTPAVKGQGEWVNSSVYVFQPEKILLSGTRYQVKVDAGLKDTLGNTLGESFNWQFSTRAPAIAYFSLKDGADNPTEEVKDVPLDQAFIVTFQQPMDQISTEGAVRITNRETHTAFPVDFSWDKTFSILSIEPKGKFKIANFYDLTVGASAQADDGGNLKDGLTVQFATVAFPSIASVDPKPDSKSTAYNSAITITFSAPMDFDSMKSRVNISPPIAGKPNWYYSAPDKTLTIYGLEPARDYVVRIHTATRSRMNIRIPSRMGITPLMRVLSSHGRRWCIAPKERRKFILNI